uniref:Uncharacterized protein n=1 Tax=Oryza punctata TaxID=4537 RepID=A0A0E0MNV6_ORYPU
MKGDLVAVQLVLSLTVEFFLLAIVESWMLETEAMRLMILELSNEEQRTREEEALWIEKAAATSHPPRLLERGSEDHGYDGQRTRLSHVGFIDHHRRPRKPDLERLVVAPLS